MCIILVGKIGKDLHLRAKSQNPDGFSLFTAEQGLIKTPDAAQVKEAVDQFGIWHYRIRSSGHVSKDNIHPFPVARGKAYLYHNGVLFNATGSLSDTALFAKTQYDASIGTVKSVLSATSASQRFLLVNAKDPTDYLLYGDWKVGEGGVLMSHTMYSATSGVSYYTRAGWAHDDEIDDAPKSYLHRITGGVRE